MIKVKIKYYKKDKGRFTSQKVEESIIENSADTEKNLKIRVENEFFNSPNAKSITFTKIKKSNE